MENLNNIKVLVVDDEERFREVLFKRLKKRGFNLKEAEDGAKCLDILKKEPINVIVSDVKMPNMSGLELLCKVKASYPETEILLLTGNANTNDGVLGIKNGAFDYLRKPIELDHLINKIKQAYDKIISKKEKKKIELLKKEMEKNMQKAKRLAALGTLAAGVAHEINNPLAIINEANGWLKQILKREEMRNIPRIDDLKKGLEKTENAIKRARSITHQLLASVKEEAPVISEVALKPLMQEAVSAAIAESPDTKTKFIYEYEIDEELKFWLDPNPLRQILINLIKNALFAVDNEGEVRISLNTNEEKINIEIADNGIGMAKEHADRIFEPFFTTKSANKGSGLGLFVIKSIIDKHGWNIKFKSELSKGTSFHITIPIDDIKVKYLKF
mmetsp:Transcript_5059/g.2829  ORF Transcript_5059/g.2829 Transcript_5059/m.2829 type:complete len:387 (+) Transcript_5059:35-1195(+)